jgi:hypothetical protein
VGNLCYLVPADVQCVSWCQVASLSQLLESMLGVASGISGGFECVVRVICRHVMMSLCQLVGTRSFWWLQVCIACSVCQLVS